MGLKFWNTKLNIFLQNNIYKMPTLWNSEVNKVILEQAKVASRLLLLLLLLYAIWETKETKILKNKNYVKKNSSRNSTLCKFLIKIYLESFKFSYHFIIYLESSTKVFVTTWISHWNPRSSVKSSISAAQMWVQPYLKMPLGSIWYTHFSLVYFFQFSW